METLAQKFQIEKQPSLMNRRNVPELCEVSCDDLNLQVNAGKGIIQSLAVRDHSLMVGDCGYVAVEDRTTGRFHFKPEQAVPVESLKEGTLSLRQTDSSAGMVVTQRFIPCNQWVEWSVEVETTSTELREVHLHFVLPVFGADSHGFSAHSRCPMIPGTGNDHRMLVYGPNMFNEENFHCSVLPMVSVYDPKTDAGLVVVQPVEMAKPRMEYFFVRENPDLSLVVRWTHLRLTRGQSVKAKMLLAPIRGCWRDAVRFVHDLYPDYFHVHEPAVFKHEGPMTCAELLPENHLNHLVEEQKLSWQEIHAYVFPRYGEYAPRNESWTNWVTHGKLEYFDLERLSRTEFRGMLSAVPDKKEEIINRRQFNAYIDKLHSKGVGAFLYTNPVVVSIDHINDFPESLATCAEGTPFFRDYFREAPMNPAAGTTWAKHLDSMTQRMLEQFPGIDGFFVDELHWNQFDFAHDDGVSARGNKPVAMIGFAVQDAVRRICEMAHQKGKAIWANGPNTVEVAHYIDGFMAEVSWEWLGTVRYLGLEKPVVLLMSSDLTVDQLKKALDTALFAGAQPSVLNQAPMDSERLEVIHRYQILFQMLRGRRWILHPHAITLEAQGMRANCFALPEGDFAVTLAPTGESDYQLRTSDGYAMDKENIRRVEGLEKNMKVTLQWPELATVRSAKLFSVTEPDHPVELKMERTQGGLSLTLSSREGGVIRLSGRS